MVSATKTGRDRFRVRQRGIESRGTNASKNDLNDSIPKKLITAAARLLFLDILRSDSLVMKIFSVFRDRKKAINNQNKNNNVIEIEGKSIERKGTNE